MLVCYCVVTYDWYLCYLFMLWLMSVLSFHVVTVLSFHVVIVTDACVILSCCDLWLMPVLSFHVATYDWCLFYPFMLWLVTDACVIIYVVTCNWCLYCPFMLWLMPVLSFYVVTDVCVILSCCDRCLCYPFMLWLMADARVVLSCCDWYLCYHFILWLMPVLSFHVVTDAFVILLCCDWCLCYPFMLWLMPVLSFQAHRYWQHSYLNFLNRTGLSVSIGQLRCYTTCLNRLFLRLGQIQPNALKLWFNCGVVFGLISMVMSMCLLTLLVFNTLQKKPVEQQVLTPVVCNSTLSSLIVFCDQFCFL